MRKLFIITGVIACIGTVNSAQAFGTSGIFWNPPTPPKQKTPQKTPQETPPQKPQTPPKQKTPDGSLSQHECLQIIDLLKKKLEVSQRQLKKVEETHQSIAGNRTKSPEPEEDRRDLYFQNPQFIYDKQKHLEVSGVNKITGAHNISEDFSRVLKSELYPANSTTSAVRDMINRRKQYAEFMDKTVALRVFNEIENRFQKITEMLSTLDQINDLKGVNELQVRMKGMLAMIQNETTKMQMIAHSRNIEQALISRLQRRRNVQILGSTNTTMPRIKSSL